MMSQFWKSGGKRTLTKEWAAKDTDVRREHWQNRTPAELIPFERYRKLPAKRRQAIEAAAYQRSVG